MKRLSVSIVTVVLLGLVAFACAPAAAPSPTAAPAKPAATSAPAAKAAATAAPASAAKPAAAPAKPKGDLVTVTYGIPSYGGNQLHVPVGQKKGFYEREGINLDVVMTQSVPLIAQGLQGGSIHVGNLGADSGVPAIEKGADIVYIAGVQDTTDWTVIALPEIKSYTDLKNKPLGVATLKGGSSTIFLKLLQQNGLKDDEIDFVQAGGTSGRIAALESKSIVAGLISTPQSGTLIGKGYTVLGEVSDAFPHYALAGLTVKGSWAKQNEDLVTRIVRAHVNSINWLYDPANRAEASSIMAEFTKVPQDVATGLYDKLVGKTKVWSPQGRFDLEGYRVAMQLLQEDGALAAGPLPDPKKYMDTHYLEKVGVNPPTR